MCSAPSGDVLRLYIDLAEACISPHSEAGSSHGRRRDVGIVVDTNSFYYGYRKLPPGGRKL